MENKNLVSQVFEVVRKHEGFKSEPYLDHKKNWTIGIGTLIGTGKEADLKASPYYKKSINEETAKNIALGDINKKIDLSKRLLGPEKFDSFSPRLQAQIVQGAYRGDITGSPKTLQLLKQGNFKEASKEFLNSEEYRKSKQDKTGVAGRMEEIAAAIAEEKPKGFAESVEKRIAQTNVLP
jgi:GH24 family phage-related lysozyme (muramidase)